MSTISPLRYIFGTPLRYCPSYPGSKPGISLSDSQRISLVPPARIELAFQLSQSRVFSTIRRRDNCSSFVLTCWFPLLIYRELPKRRMSPAPESDRAIRVCNPAHNRSANRTYFGGGEEIRTPFILPYEDSVLPIILPHRLIWCTRKDSNLHTSPALGALFALS